MDFFRAIYELWAIGPSYSALHAMNKQNRPRWDTETYHNARFRFNVLAYCHTIPKTRQREVMEGFAYMGYKVNAPLTEWEYRLNVCVWELLGKDRYDQPGVRDGLH